MGKTNYNKVEEPKEKAVDDREVYEDIYPGQLNFREKAGGKVLFILKKGERMRFTGKTEEYNGDIWLSMETRGKQGFVMSKYVEKV